jgi:hypothetical protein
MKPILIDDIQKEFGANTEQFVVKVDGEKLQGWQIAKPLNFDPKYLSVKERKEMADAIMEGKAIAVKFFEDLTFEEQTEYVKNKLIYNKKKGK